MKTGIIRYEKEFSLYIHSELYEKATDAPSCVKTKVLSLVLVLAMVLALSAGAFAADPDNPVTVTGLTKDDVAHFYKVVEWQDADATHNGGWKFTSAFNSLTAADLLAITGDPTADPVKEPALTAELAGKIARLASGAGTAVTVGDDAKAELAITGDDGAGSGLFLVLITPADADTVYNPVFVGADYVSGNNSNTWAVAEGSATYSDNAATKKSTLTLTKEADTTEDSWDDGESYSTAVGDTVSFTVNTTIPGYGTVYANPHFVMTDSLNNLALKEDTVTLVAPTGLSKYNAETNTGTNADAWDYKVETTASGYTITFSKRYLTSVVTPTDVEVTYDAIVTTAEFKSVDTEKNTVQIEYSHNPNDETDYNYKKDTTQHYTFSLDADVVGGGSSASGKKTSEVVKIGVKADGTPITETTYTSTITDEKSWEGPLAGAVFGLYTDSDCNNPYVPKKADGTAGTALTNITTLADGRMHIEGLDAGTYYLKEISAPEGFIKDPKAYKIVITAHMTDPIDVTETINGKEVTYQTEVLDYYTVTIDDQPVATHHFDHGTTDTEITWTETDTVEAPFPITNTQGTELPSTGGIGTTIFYLIGGLLVVGAGVVLVTRRRVQA